MEKYLIFTYGSLLKGCTNNEILESGNFGSTSFVGEAKTIKKFPFVVSSFYNIPTVLNKPGIGNRIKGELYEVDKNVLFALDNLERHPIFYQRSKEKFEINDSKEEIEAQIYLVNDFKEELLELKFYDSYKSYLENGEKLAKYAARNPFSTYDPRAYIINNWSNMYVIAGGPPYSVLLPQGISLEAYGGIYLGEFTTQEAWKIIKIDETSFFTWNSVKEIPKCVEETDITTSNYLTDVTAYRRVVGGVWALDVTLLEQIDKKLGFLKVSKRDRIRGFLENSNGERKHITTQIYVLNPNVVLELTSKNIASLTDTYTSKNLQSMEEATKKISNNE